MIKRNTMESVFDRYVVNEATGCWEWTRSKQDGYGYLRIGNKMVKAHRAAFEFAFGPIPKDKVLDHICHNRGCVNPNHLRLCTRKENARNQTLRITNTSGLKGAFWHKRAQRWYSAITIDGGKLKHLGSFDTAQEAHEAYCAAAILYHGKFANFGEGVA